MHVLLGVGGSDLSYQALDETIERAREAGDEVTVAVFDGHETDAGGDEVQERVRERLDETGFEAEIRLLSGDPGSRLVDVAESEGFDRIVLGSGERSTLGKIQLGSIAEFVLLNAQTPVTLIR
ncbi:MULTISPECIES: universal stress protein [Halomicrobium]|uniref:UspA domain protein n=2 Tax=Halomicrobium mukohataei TaxID=57705 RepID=C7NWZ3_HALMD|nr:MULTISPECIES: universal stress protein [Halomicrobium]ACV46358.1 UspA domain protein [Halomicrobium mukohataei DSM 12286]QCD64913.1 universal stress protein [Halomicrobium mukohataei]QFR19719.1 universal stress protein [Halomicrobium sp. ZPS1]